VSPLRIHKRAEIGDRFETQKVIAFARKKHSNERVRVRCMVCGHEKEAFVFNLRRTPGCTRCKRTGAGS
jgi:hypothetical protein